MWMTLILALGMPAAPEGVKFFEGSWDDALKEAAKSQKLIFADFYTDW